PSESTRRPADAKRRSTEEAEGLAASACTDPATGAATWCLWPAKEKAPLLPTWTRTVLRDSTTLYSTVSATAAEASHQSKATRVAVRMVGVIVTAGQRPAGAETSAS